MELEDLHAEIDTYRFANWHIYAILHAMVDAGIIVEITCMDPDCLMPGVPFAKKASRGQPDGLNLDHIIPRRERAMHRLENLRLAHTRCNASWRRGVPGTFLNDSMKERIAESVRRAHREGRGRWRP